MPLGSIRLANVQNYSRRKLLASGAALLLGGSALTGCSDANSATVRFKVIVDAFVDGEPVQGTSVNEVRYTRLTNSALGYGGRTQEYGEAVVLDMGSRGAVFVLPRYQAPDLSIVPIYPSGLLYSVGVKGGVGNLKAEDIEYLKSFGIGQKFRFELFFLMGGSYVEPFMVTFKDKSNPETMIEVTRENFRKLFGAGAHFGGVTLEITDEPVTKGKVEAALPLLKDRNRAWWDLKTRPPERSQFPLWAFVTRNSFFERGSR